MKPCQISISDCEISMFPSWNLLTFDPACVTVKQSSWTSRRTSWRYWLMEVSDISNGVITITIVRSLGLYHIKFPIEFTFATLCQVWRKMYSFSTVACWLTPMLLLTDAYRFPYFHRINTKSIFPYKISIYIYDVVD